MATPAQGELVEGISSLHITRFLPAPSSGQKEWVELQNRSDSRLGLAGWQLDDAEGGSEPTTLTDEDQIAPNGLLQVELSHSILNNGGDDLRLLAPNGTLVDQVHFTKAGIDQVLCHNASAPMAMACDEATATSTGNISASATTAVEQAQLTSTPHSLHSNATPTGILKATPQPSVQAKPSAARPYMGKSAVKVYKGVSALIVASPSPVTSTVKPLEQAQSSSFEQSANDWLLYASLLMTGAGATTIVWQRLRSRDAGFGKSGDEADAIEEDQKTDKTEPD